MSVFFIMSSPHIAECAPLNWPEKKYPYVAVEQNLRDVLTALGHNMGVGIKLSANVKGMVRGHLPAMTAREFLTYLTRAYGLIWYYDGQVLEISTIRDLASRVVSLERVSFQRLFDTLQALEIWDDRYPLKNSPGTGVLMVAGPKRYVELVAQTANELEKTAPRFVRVFRGSSGSQNAGRVNTRPTTSNFPPQSTSPSEGSVLLDAASIFNDS